MAYRIMPPTKAMSVPERSLAYTSAIELVRLKRGSTCRM
jgi:hypothetical protein